MKGNRHEGERVRERESDDSNIHETKVKALYLSSYSRGNEMKGNRYEGEATASAYTSRQLHYRHR